MDIVWLLCLLVTVWLNRLLLVPHRYEGRSYGKTMSANIVSLSNTLFKARVISGQRIYLEALNENCGLILCRTLILFFFLFKETTIHENPEVDKGRYETILFISFPLTCY